MTVTNGDFCDYYEDQVLTDLINNRCKAIILLTALPPDQGTGSSPQNGTEVANANGYARVALTAANWTKGVQNTTQQMTYSAAITFPTASGSWGNIVGWAITDNTGYGVGNWICYGLIVPTVSVGNGQQPSWPANTIVISID